MSWAPGWYGYVATSDERSAWGPEETPEAARVFPGFDWDEDDQMVIRVFHIDKSEQPSPSDPNTVAMTHDNPDPPRR